MIILRTILLVLIAGVSLILTPLLIPASHTYILSKVASHYLDMNVSFQSPSANFSTYDINATLEKDHHLHLHLNYENIAKANAHVQFLGNINIFSTLATVSLPSVRTKIHTSYDKSNILKVNAKVLDGTLDAWFDISNLSYSAIADDLNISSYLAQQEIEPFVKGRLSLKSAGNFETITDLNVSLVTKELFLLQPTLKYIPDTNNSEVALFCNATLKFKENTLHSNIELNSSLANINIEQLYYNLDRDDFYLKLELQNYINAYAPLEKLQTSISGSYMEDKLLADVNLNADGYKLELNDLNYTNEHLHTQYKLFSKHQELLDIQKSNALYGTLTYVKEELNATMTSSYLNDTVALNFHNDILHVKANALSLEGILKHIKQEELTSTLNTNQPIGLNLHVIHEADTITIKPKITSTLLTLNEGSVIYDINNSFLHVNTLFEDVNISHYYNPRISLKSDINLSKSPNFTAKVDFKALHHVSGILELKNSKKTLEFTSHLSDINTSYYASDFANITGVVEHSTPLLSNIKIQTPYEKLRLKLQHDSNASHLDFTYNISKLNRFASLNPQYQLEGSGTLVASKETLQVNLKDKNFGDILLRKNDENISIKTKALPFKELFLLTNQKAVVTGNITLHSMVTPTHINATLDSKRITPIDENLSIRSTPLQLKLNLSRNDENYSGTLKVKTQYENLLLSPLKLLTVPLTFQSNFKFTSNDLQKGTLILPPELNGSLHSYGDILYHNNSVNIHSSIHNQLFVLEPLNAYIDLNRSKLTTNIKLKTQLWQKNSDINMSVHYANPLTVNGTVKTAYETLYLNNIKLNSETKEANGTYTLSLIQTPKEASIHHGSADFEGTLSNVPEQQVTLNTDSFGGNINLIATYQNINLEAETIELDKVIQFLDLNSSLKSGTADIYAEINDENLLEHNISRLKAEISIDARDLVLYGIEVDDNINHLRDFNDINIFTGNFPGKSIATSILKAPVDLVQEKNIATSKIGHVRIDGYIENGQLYLYDCALSTEENRIAAKGVIDLNTTDFHYFQIGLLQENGCTFFTQDVLGSVKEPDIELSKTSFALITGTVKSVGSVAKNTLNLGTKIISKAGSLTSDIIDGTTGYIPVVNKVTGAVSSTVTTITDVPDATNTLLSNECIPFYRGMVQHPTHHTKLHESAILSK